MMKKRVMEFSARLSKVVSLVFMAVAGLFVLCMVPFLHSQQALSPFGAIADYGTDLSTSKHWYQWQQFRCVLGNL